MRLYCRTGYNGMVSSLCFRPGKLDLLFLVSAHLYFRHLLQCSLLPSNWRHTPLIDYCHVGAVLHMRIDPMSHSMIMNNDYLPAP